MLIAVLAGYVLATLVLFFFLKAPKLTGYIITTVIFCLFAYFASFIPAINAGEVLTFSYAWVPSLSVDLVFYLDALSLFFALLITLFGAIIFFYATAYMQGMHQANRFFAYLLIFMASMLGLVLSGNVILLYIFWELTSISSFLLIGYENHKETARSAALQALLITNAGGLALLAGLILLSQQAGSFEISNILNHTITGEEHSVAVLILILLGCFTKSAQFPFHFWLPNAMAAPTPVSAYLHSATMVKAGIFLLFRFQSVLGEGILWTYTLMIIGGITMCLGAILSFIQKDLKKILAYVTISALGMMVAMIGVDTTAALQASIIYLLVHALYKGALFLMAGNIDHEAGTRDIDQLSGLQTAMPYTSIAAFLACLAMAGIPPTLGFIGKEKLYESALHAPVLQIVLLSAIFVSSVFYVAIAMKIGYGVFFGRKPVDLPKQPHEAHFPMWIGPLLLSIMGMILGIFSNEVSQLLLKQTSSVIVGETTELDMVFWHGFNVVLALSIFTLVGGFLVFYYREYVQAWLAPLGKQYSFSPEGTYDLMLDKSLYFAEWLTSRVQSGYLRKYIFTIFSFLTVILVYTYFRYDVLPAGWKVREEIKINRLYEFVPVVLIIVGLAAIFRARSRLTMLVATSMIGFGIASIFVFYSAPDVSMTQFLVETLTLVIFMLILHRLPTHTILTSESRRIWHILLSILFGGVVTLILLSIQEVDMVSHFKEYYLSNSASQGKGLNVVNVILVDFRAFDTLGEMTVLCVTALGIVALNSLNIKNRERK